eukprot:70533-Alexandrium_andersonii.AAC.1
MQALFVALGHVGLCVDSSARVVGRRATARVRRVMRVARRAFSVGLAPSRTVVARTDAVSCARACTR